MTHCWDVRIVNVFACNVAVLGIGLSDELTNAGQILCRCLVAGMQVADDDVGNAERIQHSLKWWYIALATNFNNSEQHVHPSGVLGVFFVFRGLRSRTRLTPGYIRSPLRGEDAEAVDDSAGFTSVLHASGAFHSSKTRV